MGSVPDLPQSVMKNDELISDLCRFAEGLLTEKQVRKKWHFLDDSAWAKLGEDDALVEQIELESSRRERLGLTARERAQRAFSRAPNVLANILDDDSASPRHRIESAKELRVIADNGPEGAPEPGERYQIVINLGADHKIKIDKPIKPTASRTIDHRTIDHDVPPLLAAIARKKDDGSRGGESW
jgi:hypothetical protein